MSESAVKLDELISGTQERDAIHVAVAPVTAGEKLAPGQDIGFLEDGTVGGNAKKLVGIVSPFLKAQVDPKQQFWMVLYPNTIRSLRHDWTHPAFDTQDEKTDSQRWIEEYASSFNMTYRQVMDAAEKMDERGDYTYDNSEYYKDGRYYQDIAEFWKHYEKVMGKTVSDHEATFFTCSC